MPRVAHLLAGIFLPVVLSGGAARAADAALPNCGSMSTPPVALTPHVATMEDYPPLSRALNESGETIASYVVLPNGTVGDVKVVRSSGSLRLDDATMSFVGRFQFKPALASGKPAACQNEIALRWSLRGGGDMSGALSALLMNSALIPAQADFPPGAFDRKEEGSAVAMAVIGADGGVMYLSIVRGAPFGDLNAATLAYLRRQKFEPAALNGKHTMSMIAVPVVWSLTGKLPQNSQTAAPAAVSSDGDTGQVRQTDESPAPVKDAGGAPLSPP
jgi:TonB family protein